MYVLFFGFLLEILGRKNPNVHWRENFQHLLGLQFFLWFLIGNPGKKKPSCSVERKHPTLVGFACLSFGF